MQPAGLLKIIVLLAFVAVASAVAFHSGQSAPEVRALTPPPAPTPTPVSPSKSIITVTHTYDGIPVIWVAQTLSLAYIGDETCSAGGPQIVFEAIALEASWPWRDYPPCNLVGVPIRICESELVCSDEFTYTGEDVSVNLQVAETELVTLATARFVHAGEEQAASVTGWRYEAGGMVCSAGPTSAIRVPPAKVPALTRFWPPHPVCGAQHVEVYFNTIEFGILHASFEWKGISLEYDVETGGFLTPSVSPSPSSSPSSTGDGNNGATPAELPRSGGRP